MVHGGLVLALLPFIASTDGIEVSETGRIRSENASNLSDESEMVVPGPERERRATGRRRGALWALCHLGDAAAVLGDVNCSEVLLPSDYLQVCGRWQCRDPFVDYCFFSSGSLRAHAPLPANDSNETMSLPLQRAFRWRPETHGNEAVDPDEERPLPPAKCFWPFFPRRRRPMCYEDLVEREIVARKTLRPRPSPPPRSCPPESCCSRSNPFFVCDSDSGAHLSRLWQLFGDSLVSKLVPRVPSSSRSSAWHHCADEGQICLCLGEVRFGVEGHEEGFGNASLSSSWASETLLAKNGLVFCTEETFDGAPVAANGANTNRSGERRVCHCNAGRPTGPLVVPSNETRLVSADNVSRSSARAMSEEGRFIRSQPYSDDFLNGVRYDYASMHAGARLVTHAKGLLHAKAVISPDKSLYMLSPCETRTWFVISLLEDIFVEYVGLVTLELFASGYRHLQILGSNQYPTETWRLLGEVESNSTSNYELFDVGSRCQRLAEECWVRFLKIRVLSHHRMEDNSFCALTRFQTFGATATNFVAKERTKETSRDRRVEPSLLDVARWHEDAAKVATLPPDVQRAPSTAERPSAPHGDSEGKEAKSLTDLPLALLKDATTWLRSKVLHRPAVAPPEDDGNATTTPQPEAKPVLSDMLVELNVSATLEGSSGSGLASLEKLQATLDSLAAEAAPSASAKAKKDSSMPALVAINKELREMQQSQSILQEHNKHVISCLNTMLALVVQLFNEQNARMKTIEETSHDSGHLPQVRRPWWAIERTSLSSYPKKECQAQEECEENVEIPGVPMPSLPLWEQLLYRYPVDRLLLAILAFWHLCRLLGATLRSTSPEVEVHEEVHPTHATPSKSRSKGRPHATDANRTVSGVSGRRLQRELQRELSKGAEPPPRAGSRRNRGGPRSRASSTSEVSGAPSRRDGDRAREGRDGDRAFEILCRQLPQTPPLLPRTRDELRSSGDERTQRLLRRHRRREEVDSSSPRHRTDSASSSERDERDERDEAWQSRVASELGGEVPELPQFKAPKRRAPKRYSSAARRHPVHLAARKNAETATNSPVTGPAESQ